MAQTPPRPRQKGADPEQEARLAAELAAYAASDAQYGQYLEADDGDLGAPPSLEEALAMLEASGSGAAEREGRRAFGVAPALIDDMAWLWRAQSDLPGRLALARGLWASEVHEAMLAAAKLLTQARLRPDAEAWALLAGWAAGLAGATTADAAAGAIGRRLIAAPGRLAEVAGWTAADNPWTRRAALIATLPFARLNHPDPEAQAARITVLGWCAVLMHDKDQGVVRAVGQWLRTLAKHDSVAVAAWCAAQAPLPAALGRL